MTIKGIDKLFRELDWVGGNMDGSISEQINNSAERGAMFMDELVPVDTGYLKNSLFYQEGHLKAQLGNTSTHYAGFVNGNVPITAFHYPTTPFLEPTINYINMIMPELVFKVVGAMKV